MDLRISDELKTRLKGLEEFLEKEVYPLETEVQSRGFRAMLPDLERRRDRMRELGFWCPHLSREDGGGGLRLTEFAQVSEILGRSSLGHYIANCQAPDAANMELLARHGTDAQKSSYLEPLVRGEIRSCFSMTEPDRPGSNPTWMDTEAKRDGDHYVINGRKWFTSSADGAAFAIVMAVTQADAPRHERASIFIVPTDSEGFRLVRNIPIFGHVGEDYLSHAEVEYSNCRVPANHLLGKEGAGFRMAQARLGPGRIHHCMRWIGICERAFDLLCRRAVEREIAPGTALATRQLIQTWIAECRVEIRAARLLVLDAAWTIESAGAAAAREAISAIKFYVADVLMKVLDRAIQVHGALGLTDDTPLATFYRHERGARIYDGPDEVHKMVVARLVLKRYGLEV